MSISVWILGIAAIALSIERICYVWIWHSPETFSRLCARSVIAAFGWDPVEVLQKLFYGFKAIQITVFVGWCYFHDTQLTTLLRADFWALGLGGSLLLIGQALNLSVFYRLGKIGVFYGSKLGYQVPWCHGFPFSVLKHPQYVGAVFSIWGFFLTMRFPYEDWYLLPSLETVYYILGAYFEES